MRVVKATGNRQRMDGIFGDSPVEASFGCDSELCWFLYVPEFSSYNSWNDHLCELEKSACIKVQLKRHVEQTEKSLILGVVVVDALSLLKVIDRLRI